MTLDEIQKLRRIHFAASRLSDAVHRDAALRLELALKVGREWDDLLAALFSGRGIRELAMEHFQTQRADAVAQFVK